MICLLRFVEMGARVFRLAGFLTGNGIAAEFRDGKPVALAAPAFFAAF